MKENKIDTITNLFEGSEIRSIWDSEKEEALIVIQNGDKSIFCQKKEGK